MNGIQNKHTTVFDSVLVILVIKVLVKCKNLVWGDYSKHGF